MENKKKAVSSGSRFASIPGLILLAFFLILSFYFRASMISAFLLIVLLLCLIAVLWSSSVAHGLHAFIRVLTPACFPGEKIRLELTLQNTGVFPAIWADVLLPLPNGQKILPQSSEIVCPDIPGWSWNKESTRQKFTWLPPGRQLSCTLTFHAVHRGIVSWDSVCVQSGDGFGIGVSGHPQPLKEQTTAAVYPRLFPVHLQKLILRGADLENRKYGEAEDITLLKTIRPYLFGDSFKRINWRLLARQQTMYVNLYEEIAPESIAFLLDLKSFETTRPGSGEDSRETEACVQEDAMETAISLAASCVVSLGERGVPCILAIPAYAEQSARFLVGDKQSETSANILLSLAELSYNGGVVHWPGEMLERLAAGSRQIYVITCGQADPALLRAEAAAKMKWICINRNTTLPAKDTLAATDLLNTV